MASRPEFRWTAAVALLTLLLSALAFAVDNNVFFNDDNQNAMMPVYTFIARSWLRGQVPLVSDHSWFSGAIAADSIYGSFNLVHQLVLVLSLMASEPATRCWLITTFYLILTATGAFRLARSLGQDRSVAVSSALCFTFSGFLFNVMARAWVLSLVGLGWLMWSWALLHGGAAPLSQGGGISRPREALALALTGYGASTSGWPYADVWLVLLFLVYIGRSLAARRLGEVGLMMLGLLWACGLSAPCVLMLLQSAGDSERHFGANPFNRLALTDLAYCLWTNPPLGLHPLTDFLVVPRFNMNVGFLPCLGCLLAPWALRRNWRQHWPVAVVLVVSLGLACLPSPAGFRWSYRWLPILLCALVLLGHSSLQALTRRGRGGLVLAVALVVGLGIGWHGAILLGLLEVSAGLYLLAGAGSRGIALACLVCLLGRAGLDFEDPGLTTVHPHYPHLPTRAPFLDDLTDRRVLALYSRSEWGVNCSEMFQTISPGNLPFYQDKLELLTGFSPLRPYPLSYVLGMEYNGTVDLTPNLELLLGPSGYLNRWGVDRIWLSRHYAPMTEQFVGFGWKKLRSCVGFVLLGREQHVSPAFAVESARSVPTLEAAMASLARPSSVAKGGVAPLAPPSSVAKGGVAPLAPPSSAAKGGVAPLAPPSLEEDPQENWAFAPVVKTYRNARLTETKLGASHCQTHVTPSPGTDPTVLVGFHHPWRQGFQARFNGQPVPVARLSTALLAAVVPAVEGELSIDYLPEGLELGLFLAALTMLSIGLSGLYVALRASVDRRGLFGRASRMKTRALGETA